MSDILPRFGGRLRDWLRQVQGTATLSALGAAKVEAVAAAIDDDAIDQVRSLSEVAVREAEERVANLRRLVEEAIDFHAGLLDTAPLRAAVTEILGPSDLPLYLPSQFAQMFRIEGRSGASGLDVAIEPDGTTFLRPVDACIAGFVLRSEAAVDLLRLLSEQLPTALSTLKPRGRNE